MDANRFDSVSKFFAQRRLSRREAMIQGGTALAATGLAATGLAVTGRARKASAQEATPAAAEDAGPRDPEMLFVQSFQAGAIAPKEGAEGRYTLTLESGSGQTIYFSDRPDRIVGALPTPEILDALGFAEDDPPNAALVVENAAGETDVAVVELFSPVYDEATGGVTYEIEVLANWEAEVDMTLHEAPTDLAAVEPNFGSAHLFIDGIADCPDGPPMQCTLNGTVVGEITNAEHDGYCRSWLIPGSCLPCEPWNGPTGIVSFWQRQCNERFADCQGACEVDHWCTWGAQGSCPWDQ